MDGSGVRIKPMLRRLWEMMSLRSPMRDIGRIKSMLLESAMRSRMDDLPKAKGKEDMWL